MWLPSILHVEIRSPRLNICQTTYNIPCTIIKYLANYQFSVEQKKNIFVALLGAHPNLRNKASKPLDR